MRFLSRLIVTLPLLACGDGPATLPSEALAGRWELVSANGAAVPNAVVHSGSITFLDGGEYEAMTCYATSPAPCDGGRIEQGTFSVAGDVVTLVDGSYSRSLTRFGARLTQSGGGDTGSAVLLYERK